MNSKTDQEESFGSGRKWVRGKKIGEGSFASIFLAFKSHNPNNAHENNDMPEIFAVKSAKLKHADSIRKELVVFDEMKRKNGGSCPFVINHLGEDLTVSNHNEEVYNLCLEVAWGSLAKYIGLGTTKHHHALPEHEARRYTVDILRGVKHIHRSGYVHCDLKPENILLVKNDEGFSTIAKVGDLGLAKKNEARLGRRGTPVYLAPETINYDKQEYASDVWAVGLIVLEMLTGEEAKGHYSSRENNRLFVVDGLKPKMPNTLSYNAKEFIECCLAEDTRERWTIDELLCHPFVYDGVKPSKFRCRFSLRKLNCFSKISCK